MLAAPRLAARRLGLVTNDAARTAPDPGVRSRVALQQAGFPLVRLFAPEHGLGAMAADGAAIRDGFDALTGLPVVSLYGERMKPSRASLADLDLVLFDVPDIGARFYTYIWTLWHVLEACAEFGRPLLVLDRPNPLSGDLCAAEGPLLDTEKCASFLGRANIPIRHSLTVGELASLWNREQQWGADLRVIPCTGWKREQPWPETGLPFLPTSPAIPSYESALLYPGLCLLEATNLSVGRGTDLPFQIVGAPWLNAAQLAGKLNAVRLPGVVGEPVEFVPDQNPCCGARCQGVQLHVTDSRSFRPVKTGLLLLASVIHTHRAEFRWAHYPTAANPTGVHHFERLLGRTGIQDLLQDVLHDVASQLEQVTAVEDWRERVQHALLYPPT